ncbi:SAM-dependent methyltransferase [Nocardia terpenica]|uniref:SAM-dependent methyltransferase n=1 Tax=Nocardia terpenica TaxID=455432 RepID=UPI0012FE7C7B|nr:methyltransferase domain-containing protein [Nocardia terpenica]
MRENVGQADDVDRLQAGLAAKAAMKSWAEGMELLELVRSAHDAGWLDRLRAATTPAELAAAQGVTVEQASNVLAVFTVAGMVEADGASFRLTPTFDALVAGVSGIEMSAVLDALDLARHRVGRAARPIADPPGLTGEQALVLARDWGVRPGGGAQQLYRLLFQSLPEFRARLDRGGPVLDVGSGVGGGLLTTLSLFDSLRAVGVEVVPEVAAELRRRAEDAGVADRVAIRTVDARALTYEAFFPVCYWAQAFFTTDARADTLAAILRALLPGGVLLMQEDFPPLPPDEPTLRAALDRLFFRQQDAAFGLSAQALAAEAITAGFEHPEIIDNPLGRLVLVRKPDLRLSE